MARTLPSPLVREKVFNFECCERDSPFTEILLELAEEGYGEQIYLGKIQNP